MRKNKETLVPSLRSCLKNLQKNVVVDLNGVGDGRANITLSACVFVSLQGKKRKNEKTEKKTRFRSIFTLATRVGRVLFLSSSSLRNLDSIEFESAKLA